jgi:predicted MFS family arabinose efflux permease
MIRTIFRAYRSAYAGLSREVWLLALVLVVNRAGSMVLPFLSLYLTQVRGLPIVAAGRILALYGLGAIAGSYAGGWLSDKIGATRTQQIGLMGSGFAYLWLSVLDDPGQISVAVLVLSVFVESYRPAVMADMAELAGETVRLRAFALLRLAANVGVGIGPAVGGYLALHSYRWLFVADAVTCWLACLMLALWLDPLHGSRRDARATATDVSPWRDVPYLLLMSLVVVLASALFQFFSTLPVYFREIYGFREDAIGLLLALNPLIIVLFEMVLIRWAESRGRFALIGLGAFLTCGGLALMPFGRSVAFVVLTIGVWTTGEMLVLPLLNAVVADRASPGRRGQYMGIYTMAYSLALVFAPAGGTHVYESLGPDRLWFGIGALGVVLWAWALGLSRAFRPRLAPDDP